MSVEKNENVDILFLDLDGDKEGFFVKERRAALTLIEEKKARLCEIIEKREEVEGVSSITLLDEVEKNEWDLSPVVYVKVFEEKEYEDIESLNIKIQISYEKLQNLIEENKKLKLFMQKGEMPHATCWNCHRYSNATKSAASFDDTVKYGSGIMEEGQHSHAIKENLIPSELTSDQMAYTCANEADMLNVVLFGMIAKQWKDENPTEKGNMRDKATLNQLLVLANLKSYNAVLINQGKSQKERMELLRQLAVQQLQTLETVSLNNLPKLTVSLQENQIIIISTDELKYKIAMAISVGHKNEIFQLTKIGYEVSEKI